MADSAQESASVSKDTILYDVWIHEDATLQVQPPFSSVFRYQSDHGADSAASSRQPDQLVPAPAPLEAHKGAIWKTIGTGM